MAHGGAFSPPSSASSACFLAHISPLRPTPPPQIAYYKLNDITDVQLLDNTVDSTQYIGVVTDATHYKTSGVVCKGNTPPATIAGKPC